MIMEKQLGLGSEDSHAPGASESSGEHVDDFGPDQGFRYGFKLLDLEFLFPGAYPILECPLCHSVSTSEAAFCKHVVSTHKGHGTWMCLNCKISFDNYRGLTCHLPKCPGPKEVTEGSFRCVSVGCNRSFGTRRGLSTHVRHAHPDQRNAERIADMPVAGTHRSPTAHSSKWTIEERSMVEHLEKLYEGKRNINKLIAIDLHGSKTNKQVNDYRSMLRRKRCSYQPDETLEGEELNDSVQPDLSTPGQSSPLFSVSSGAGVQEPNDGSLGNAGQELVDPCGERSSLVEAPSTHALGSMPSDETTGSALQDPTLASEGVVTEQGSLSCDSSHIVLLTDQVPQCGTADPILKLTVADEADALLREETNMPLRENHLPEQDSILESDDPVNPATEQADTFILEGESDDPMAPFKAWRKWVASYALKIKSEILSPELDRLLVRLEDVDNSNHVVREEIEAVVDALLNVLKGSGTARPSTTKKKRKVGGHSNHASRKRILYARTQDLYHNKQERLAEWAVGEQTVASLLDEQDGGRPTTEAFGTFYSRLWGVSGDCQSTILPAVPRCTSDVLREVTPQQVRLRLKRVKKDSAPGPDGVTKDMVQSIRGAPEVLAKLFNVVMLTGLFPSQWKVHKTTMIPKSGGDPREVGNWRPITIGSLLGRLYSGLLDTRLRTVTDLHERQVGFVPMNGCATNLFIFDECVRAAKKEGLLSGAMLDIQKAFDTVPHEAILGSLRAQGVDSHTVSHIRDMYSNVYTQIGSGDRIALQRGVKQGDPLSPLLFNLVLDPLVRALQQEGFPLRGQKIGALFFADDLIVLAGSSKEAQAQLDLVTQFIRTWGMNLNPHKSSAFQLGSSGKTWIARDPGLSVDGVSIPGANPSTVLRYLGVDYTLSKGLREDTQCDRLLKAVNRVGELALKPMQKVTLIFERIVPKFLYGMILCSTALTQLRRVDNVVRMIVKTFLHLHPSTTDHVLYSRKRDGGMGLPRLADAVRTATLRSGMTLLASEDVTVRALAVTGDLEDRCRKTANSLRLNWPVTSRQVDRARRRLKAEESVKWEKLGSQGHGVSDFRNDPDGNCWLYDANVFRPSRFIDALRLRTNTFGVNVALRRADPSIPAECRHCREKPETLGHVLGECVAGKGMRIHRHNEIVDKISEEVTAKGFTVTREESFTVDGKTLKPDLVLKDEDRAFVVDVTVRFESKESLRRGSDEKRQKYETLARDLKARGLSRSCEVLPITVGSRGAIPRDTRNSLTTLGIMSKRLVRYLAICALGSSVEIACQHLDYT